MSPGIALWTAAHALREVSNTFQWTEKKVADRGKASLPHENEKGLIKYDYHVLYKRFRYSDIDRNKYNCLSPLKFFLNNSKLYCLCVVIGGSEVENYNS